jgi:hypothetical protein
MGSHTGPGWSLSPVDEEKNKQQKPDLTDDFDNCRGACGYTPWCKDCIKYSKDGGKPGAATDPEGRSAGQKD